MFGLSQFLLLKREQIEQDEVIIEPTEMTTKSDNDSSRQTSLTDPAVGDAWKLITSRWQLDEPKMIISVTGGARRFYMKQRLLKSFKRGLMKAAIAAGEQCRLHCSPYKNVT